VIHIPTGVSISFFEVVSPLSLPRNVLNTIIIEYTNVNTLAIHAMIGKSMPHVSKEKIANSFTDRAAVKNISLLRKPLNGGKPAIEKLPIKATEHHTRINDIQQHNRRIY